MARKTAEIDTPDFPTIAERIGSAFIMWPVVATLLLGFCHDTYAARLLISWTAATTDTSGETIPQSSLFYKIYADMNGEGFRQVWATPNTSFEWNNVRNACYDVYVTAVRNDTDPELESGPSNTASTCISADPTGPEAPEEEEPVIVLDVPPVAPQLSIGEAK